MFGRFRFHHFLMSLTLMSGASAHSSQIFQFSCTSKNDKFQVQWERTDNVSFSPSPRILKWNQKIPDAKFSFCALSYTPETPIIHCPRLLQFPSGEWQGYDVAFQIRVDNGEMTEKGVDGVSQCFRSKPTLSKSPYDSIVTPKRVEMKSEPFQPDTTTFVGNGKAMKLQLRRLLTNVTPAEWVHTYVYNNMSRIIDTGPVLSTTPLYTQIDGVSVPTGRKLIVQALYGAPLIATIQYNILEFKVQGKSQYVKLKLQVDTSIHPPGHSSENLVDEMIAFGVAPFLKALNWNTAEIHGTAIQEFFTSPNHPTDTVFNEYFEDDVAGGISLEMEHNDTLAKLFGDVYLFGQKTGDVKGVGNFAKELEYAVNLPQSPARTFLKIIEKVATSAPPTPLGVLAQAFKQKQLSYGIITGHVLRLLPNPTPDQVSDNFRRIFEGKLDNRPTVHVIKKTELYGMTLNDVKKNWHRLTVTGRGTGIAEQGIITSTPVDRQHTTCVVNGASHECISVNHLRPKAFEFSEDLGDDVVGFGQDQGSTAFAIVTTDFNGKFVMGTSLNLFQSGCEGSPKDCLTYVEDGYYAMPSLAGEILPEPVASVVTPLLDFFVAPFKMALKIFAPSTLTSTPMEVMLGYIGRTHMAVYNMDTAFLQMANEGKLTSSQYK